MAAAQQLAQNLTATLSKLPEQAVNLWSSSGPSQNTSIALGAAVISAAMIARASKKRASGSHKQAGEGEEQQSSDEQQQAVTSLNEIDELLAVDLSKVEVAKAALLRACELLETEKQLRTKEKKVCSNIVQSNTATIQGLKDQIADLEGKLQASSVKASALEEQVRAINESRVVEKAHNLEREVHTLNQKLAAASEIIRTGEDKAAIAMDAAKSSEERSRGLEKKLSVADDKIRQCEEQVRVAQAAALSADKRLADALEISQVSQGVIPSLEQKVRGLEQALRNTEEDLMVSKNIARAAEERALLSDRAAHTAEERAMLAEEKVKSLEGMVISSEAAAHMVETNVNGAINAAKEAEDRAKIFAEKAHLLESQLTAELDRNHKREQELQHLMYEKEQNFGEAVRELHDTKEQLRAAIDEVYALRAATKQLEDERAQGGDTIVLAAQLKVANAALESLKEKDDQLQKLVNVKTDEISQLQLCFQSSSESLHQVRDELQRKKEESLGLEKNVEDLKLTIVQLRDQVGQQEDKAFTKDQKIATLESKIRSLNDEIARIKGEATLDSRGSLQDKRSPILMDLPARSIYTSPPNPAADLVSRPLIGDVGIRLERSKEGKLIVSGILIGSPADMSGEIFEGDVIVSIDGISVQATNMGLMEAEDRLNGEKGTRVALQLARRGRPDMIKTIALFRASLMDSTWRHLTPRQSPNDPKAFAPISSNPVVRTSSSGLGNVNSYNRNSGNSPFAAFSDVLGLESTKHNEEYFLA